jgi:prevent-host-death family protein
VSDQQPKTHIIDAAEAERQFGTHLKKVVTGRGRVVVRENGRDVAALISEADLARLENLDRQRAEGWKTIQEIHARNADIDPEEAERDIAEAIAEMRAEERARNGTAAGR